MWILFYSQAHQLSTEQALSYVCCGKALVHISQILQSSFIGTVETIHFLISSPWNHIMKIDKRLFCVISRTLVSSILRSCHAFRGCEMGLQLSQTKAYILLVIIFPWALQLPLYHHICKKTKWSWSKSHPNYNFSQSVWRRNIFLKQHTIWHSERNLFSLSQNGMSRPILLCIRYITLTSNIGCNEHQNAI